MAKTEQLEGPVCRCCGKTILYKSRRAFNRYKQYPNKNYYCDRKCYAKSMIKVVNIPIIYCANCGNRLEKPRRVFGKGVFWEKKYHFCNVQCQNKYFSEKRKTPKEKKKKNWRKYNQIGWEKQRFRNRILENISQCQICGNGNNLRIHHIKPARTHPELLYDEDNISVLCRKCHNGVHKKYGYNNNYCERDYTEFCILKQ